MQMGLHATRRGMMQKAAAAAGCAALAGILGRGAAQPVADVAPLRSGEILPTPDFGALRPTAQFFARVRPHRIGGVHLSLEPEISTAVGPKFLIHNYGHSGAGITL